MEPPLGCGETGLPVGSHTGVSRPMRRVAPMSLEGQPRARALKLGRVIPVGGAPPSRGASEARGPVPHLGAGKGPSAQMASPCPVPPERFWELLFSPLPVGPGEPPPLCEPLCVCFVWGLPAPALPPCGRAPCLPGRTRGTPLARVPLTAPFLWAQALALCLWAEWRRASFGLAWW